MKRINRIFRPLFALALCAGLFAACANEMEIEPPRPAEGDIRVSFGIDVPETLLPTTRAITDNAVSSMHMLLFTSEGYQGFRNCTPSGSSYTATIPKGTYDLVFIANCPNTITDATWSVGTAKATVLASTALRASGKWTANIPMSGELTGQAISADKTLPTVQLTRSMAKIDVDASAVSSKFTLTGVSVHNVNTGGYIYSASEFSALSSKITNATTLNYTTGIASNKLENEIYVFDSAITNATTYNAGNPCLIIAGNYDGGSTTYYRVELKDASGNYLRIQRNYKYIVTINDIAYAGASSAANAYSATSLNEAVVVSFDEADISYAETNGRDYLGVTGTELTYSGDARTTASTDNTFSVKASGTWTATVYANENGTGSASWLTIGNQTTTGCKFVMSSNITEERTAWVFITTGSITVKVKVTQAAPLLTVNPATATAAVGGDEIAVSLTALCNWTVTSSLTGATPSQTSGGSGTFALKLNVPANRTGRERTITFTFTSEDGTSSKTVSITQTYAAWAGSNIYWDGAKLTFADAGTTDKQLYQGVFFKWGSLVGVQPTTSTWSSGLTVYAPTQWSGSTTINTTGYAWDDIPTATPPTSGFTSEQNYLIEIQNVSAGIGDICRYLTQQGWAPGSQQGVQWSMPTAAEFGLPEDYGPITYTGTQSLNSSGTGLVSRNRPKYINGTSVIETVFAEGGRRATTGANYGSANGSYYWSGSTKNGLGLALWGSAALAEPQSMNDNTQGFMVRCVRIK